MSKTLVQIFLNEEETKIVDEAKKKSFVDVRNAYAKTKLLEGANKDLNK